VHFEILGARNRPTRIENQAISMKSKRSLKSFVVCVQNEGYRASLELRKIYEFIKDDAATSVGMMRIVDESGEDYLYPANFFREIALTPSLVRALTQAA
jgi:hypothetical protein